MTFTIEHLAESLASYMVTFLPGTTFYEDPNQQGTKCPCAFIQLINSEVSLRRQKFLQRTLRLDLTYLEDYNLPDLQRRYQKAAELMDLNMETVPYYVPRETTVNGQTVTVYDTAILRTQNRQAQIDLDGLHYKFDIIVWLEPGDTGTLMQTLELTEEVSYGS